MRKIILFFSLLVLITLAFGQPNKSAHKDVSNNRGALGLSSDAFGFRCNKDTTLACGTSCFTLKARIPDIHASTGNYSIQPINATDCFSPYVSAGSPGTSANLAIDDRYSSAIDIPFPFPFYNDSASPYNRLIISANGFISFDVSKADNFSHWSLAPGNVPNTAYDRSLIMGVFHDLDPSVVGSPDKQIKYDVVGVAPYRRFIISHYKVPLYSAACNSLFQNIHQIVLYETLGIIEVFVNDLQQCSVWNSGRKMIGLQNYNKDKGIMPLGRSATSPIWGNIGMNESWRFTPSEGPSMLRGVQLFDLSGNLIANGDTSSLGNGELGVSFNNICIPASFPISTSLHYVVKAKYESLVSPGSYVYSCDTINVNRVNGTAGTIRGAGMICKGISTTLSSNVAGGTWSSSNSAVASINTTSGQLTALATGTATIRYTVPVGAGCLPAVSSASVNVVNPPTTPSSITINLVSNVCGARVYRYTAPVLPAGTSVLTPATGYLWSFTGALGTTAIIDSGNINGRIIRVRYTSNEVALPEDSVRVAYTSSCGTTSNKSVKLTNTVLRPPTAPASITINLVSNNCGARVYRFTAPTLPAATSTNMAATGYLWSFMGNLGSTAVVDSGSLTSRAIRMIFTSNDAAVVGDSVLLLYTSDCGNSPVKSLKLTNTLLTAPLAPATITITQISNACGSRIYRYTAPALPAATTTSVAATGYVWSFVGALGSIGSVDSGTLNSRIVRMKFTSNAAATIGDSVQVYYTSSCDNSPIKSLKLSNLLIAPPIAPTSITITQVANVCGAKVYRYTAPTLPAATTTSVAATGYLWSFVGTLGGNATLDSGNLGSRIVRMKFTNNAAAVIGDSVRLNYASTCGYSPTKASKLSNTLLAPPLAPASITITQVSNVCGAKVYRYTAPTLPTATATNVAATGYLWSFVGTLGGNATLDSGNLGSRIVRMKFTNNAAASTGDSVRLNYNSTCGSSLRKALKLSNTLLAAPSAPTSITITQVSNVCGAKVYRYAAPSLTTATATNVAASGYLWSFVGTLGANATLDSGTLSSGVVRMKFTSNVAAVTGDSVRLNYTSSCGSSLRKALKLTNTLLSAPLAPASITIAQVSNLCSARIYRYTAPTLPAGTATNVVPTGYLWSFVGSLGSIATLDSGTLSSRIVRMKFTRNTAAATGDSARVLYTSSCGNSLRKALKLTNTAITCPTTIWQSKNTNESLTKPETDIIFPNPSLSNFSLQMNQVSSIINKITIFNSTGKILKTLQLPGNKVLHFGDDLLPGIYYVEIESGGKRITKKIIKGQN